MTKDKALIMGILEESQDITTFLKEEICSTLDTFLANRKLQKAIMMSLINISEHIKELPIEFRAKYSDVQWIVFKPIRNIAAHKYGSINFVLVWQIVIYISKFHKQLEIIKLELK